MAWRREKREGLVKVIRTNKTKKMLQSGQVAIGAAIASPAPELVELAAVAGFDFVTFDAEHEPLDDWQLADLIRAADAFDVTPIVRVPKDPDRLLRLLNIGAQGVHVPRCSSVADMVQLVKATRFYPLGERTFYRLGRGGNFNRGLTDDEWSRQTNEELLVIAMIEEASALDQLESMLEVSGVDAIHIGPKDLWQSLGMPPTEMVDIAIGKIAAAARAGGKQLSLQLQGFDDIDRQIERHKALGANMITVPLIGLLVRESEALVQRIRKNTSQYSRVSHGT
jgi:2-keto-3-deoxy-L-rhamnonate aldolase RhmA